MESDISKALKNWIPVRLVEEQGEYCCRWYYKGEHLFKEPFFEDSISKMKIFPENIHRKHSISNINMLIEWAEQHDRINPAVVIFHISRCGSTLISQLLGLKEKSMSLSEVPFFDELLRLKMKKSNDVKYLQILDAAIRFYSDGSPEKNQTLFIKTDSWHLHFYKEYRLLFPQSRFVLLYRKPDEVIRSHQKLRGMQSVPGLLDPSIFGFNGPESEPHKLDEYMARVLESYFVAMINIHNNDSNTILVNYNDGILPAMEKISHQCGLSFSDSEQNEINNRLNFHGKRPGERFMGDAVIQGNSTYLSRCFELFNELELLKG